MKSKTIIYLLAFVWLLPIQVHGQLYLHGKNTDSLNVDYCQISLSCQKFKTCYGQVFYGQNYENLDDLRISYPDGTLMTFTSLVAVLNHMSSLGWEYVDTDKEISGNFFEGTGHIQSGEATYLLRRRPNEFSFVIKQKAER